MSNNHFVANPQTQGKSLKSTTNSIFHHPFLGQVGLVSSQCHDDVWTRLSLQLPDPILSPCEGILVKIKYSPQFDDCCCNP